MLRWSFRFLADTCDMIIKLVSLDFRVCFSLRCNDTSCVQIRLSDQEATDDYRTESNKAVTHQRLTDARRTTLVSWSRS